MPFESLRWLPWFALIAARVGCSEPVAALRQGAAAHAEASAADEPAPARTASKTASDSPAAASKQPKYETISLRGRVVWLNEALQTRFGIETSVDAAHRLVALATDQGELHPIVEDVRGRAFLKDERLRKTDVELLLRRYQGSPMVQVIRVYQVAAEGKLELDYWCDTCAIAMYELKECECCQGPVRLRQTKVDASSR